MNFLDSFRCHSLNHLAIQCESFLAPNISFKDPLFTLTFRLNPF